MKLSRRFSCGLLIIFLIAPLWSKAAPVNPDASPEAKNLLAFLVSLEGHYTLTAQHNFINTGSKYTNLVEAITGKSPIIWGSDFSFAYEGPAPQKFQHCGPLNLTSPGEPLYYLNVTPAQVRQKMVETAIKEAKAGHIITLMWHEPPPGSGDACDGTKIWAMEKRPTAAEWQELVTDGTPSNLAWKKQAETIAGYLKQLRDAHVPVLWRPYHEMNGVWFWWDHQKGEAGFKRLWIMMYNYFVHDQGLNNLIWVWDTNAPRAIPGDEAGAYEDYWPGTDFVDVLAADVYRKDWKQSHHDDLAKLANGKPIVLGEVGEPPSPEILTQQPKWGWFMPWPFAAVSGPNPELLRTIYRDKRILTLHDVSLDAHGQYVVNPNRALN